ncbi:hypothetical protein Q0O04_13980 [Rossellomorea marisflavi]
MPPAESKSLQRKGTDQSSISHFIKGDFDFILIIIQGLETPQHGKATPCTAKERTTFPS